MFDVDRFKGGDSGTNGRFSVRDRAEAVLAAKGAGHSRCAERREQPQIDAKNPKTLRRMSPACYLRESRMKRRFPFCITMLGLSHLFLALPMLTSQLLPPLPVELGASPQVLPISDSAASVIQSTPPQQMLLNPDLGEPMT